MELKYIKIEACPTCGAHVVAESVRARHSNGQGYELREFACGHGVTWSPNLLRLETVYACPKSPEQARLRTMRALIKARIVDLCAVPLNAQPADLDERSREGLQRWLDAFESYVGSTK